MAVLVEPRIARRRVPRFPARLFSPIVALISALAALDAPRADESRTSEYEVKAAFLYNFAKFAEWPVGAFAEEASPIVIGIFGDDPFGAALDGMLAPKTAHSRAFAVRRIDRVEEAAECHLVFVGSSTAPVMQRLFRAVGARPVLTVGESADFLALGGMINFQVENNRVIFEVGAEASAASEVRLSSQLLKLARLVRTAGGPPNG